MQRVAIRMMIRPGKEEEYRQAHRHVWPSILEACKRVGIRNYSIFMLGRELFAYLEVPDFAGAMAELAKDPENQRWQAFMAPLMDVPMGFQEGQPLEVMEEVFHLD